MSNETLFIPKQSDKKIINCFRKIAEENGVDSFQVTAFGGSSFAISLTSDEPPKVLKILLDQGINLIDTVSLRDRGLSLSFKKGCRIVHNEPPSPYFDDITIEYEQRNYGPVEPEERIKIGAILTKELRAFDPRRTIQGLSKEQSQLQALHESMLERLEKTATTLVENLAEYGQQLQTRFQENETRRTEELERHKEKLNEEYEAKDNALNERERELNERTEEIDNRDNTHVRRELRRALLAEIQKRSDEFKLTKGTNKLRWPVHLACIIGLAVVSFGAIFYADQLTDFIGASEFQMIPFVVMTIKQVVLTLGAIGLGFFYIRWLNRWFHQHAKAEFELKQFQLDIDRASWLVETALEWKTSEGDAIPDTLMTSLTRNLFSGDDREQTEQLRHPADILTSPGDRTSRNGVKS